MFFLLRNLGKWRKANENVGYRVRYRKCKTVYRWHDGELTTYGD